MNSLRRLFFSFWYLLRPPWDTGVSPPELMDHIRTHPPGRALDLGCGSGTNTITLARHGWRVTGVDFAPSAILMARRKARSAGVAADLRIGDVTDTAVVQGPFDLILDMGCFHSLSEVERRAYTHNLGAWLAPGGVFLLYAFIPGGSGPGLEEQDLARLSRLLNLVKRSDGTERGLRPSAWLTYRKPT